MSIHLGYGIPSGYQIAFDSDVENASRERNRKVVVIVGNCLAESLAAGLSSDIKISSRFRFVAIPLHLKTIGESASQSALSVASYVLVQGFAREYVDDIRAVCSVGCKLISYPDVVLRSLWPFDKSCGYNDAVVEVTPDAPIRHHDGALAILRTLEKSKAARLERYRNMDFPGGDSCRRVLLAQSKFLKRIDEESGFRFGEYISLNYQKLQLFYDPVHPSAVTLQMMCEVICRRLGVIEFTPKFSGMDGFSAWSVPVHPAIAQALDLVWANDATNYTYGSLGSVTWKEWVETYVDLFG